MTFAEKGKTTLLASHPRRADGADEAQLALPGTLEPEPGEEWWRALPDRSGAYDYLVLVMGPDDPERSPRAKGSDKSPHLTVAKTPATTWADRIEQHMSDGERRTFNRITIELIDKSASVVGGTPVESGLWLLVERGALEYTPTIPVYFRRVA